MGSLLLTIRCLSIIHLVMAAPYPLTISQNQSLFCGCLSRKAEQRDSVHPSFKKDKNKGIPSVMNAFVTILACVCLLGCLPHSSASTYDKMPPLDIECKTVVFVEGAHHPMSRLVSVVVYRRPQVPQGIQQSMLVQTVVLEERNWDQFVTQDYLLMSWVLTGMNSQQPAHLYMRWSDRFTWRNVSLVDI